MKFRNFGQKLIRRLLVTFVWELESIIVIIDFVQEIECE
jgi:hypothetical protein